MKLTKRKALQLTRDLWTWLSKDKDREKDQWPKWKFNGGNVPRMSQDCPCCQFAGGTESSTTNRNCDKCPLLDFWSEFKSGGVPCTGFGSPYHNWSMQQQKVANANTIAKAAKKELVKL